MSGYRTVLIGLLWYQGTFSFSLTGVNGQWITFEETISVAGDFSGFGISNG